MPFGLKNAPMIYQRLIDNALWGYVQPRGGWVTHAERVHLAESSTTTQREQSAEPMTQLKYPPPNQSTKFEADHRAIAESDAMQDLVNGPDGDMFVRGDPDESTLVPVFERRSFVDDICFGGVTFDDCLATLDKLLTRFAECRISISFTKSIFVKPSADFLSHEISPGGIRASPKKIAAIAELPFPSSKKGMQAFLGALNYYSRFIRNLAVYGAALYQLKEDDFTAGGDLTTARTAFAELKTNVANAPILRHFDSAKEVHVMLFANDWALSSTLLQLHDDKLHPVRFCGRVLKENEVNYHSAEKEVLALLQLLKICYTLLAGKTIHVYTRFSTLEWVFNSKTLYGRSVSFAVLLSPFHLKVKRIRERDAEFVQLLQASVTPHIGLDESLSHVAPPSKNSATVRLDPELLYAHVPRDFTGYVLSFDGSAKTEKNGGYGSCSWILWRLPDWDIEIAASAYLSSTTVNVAEYTGMNNGVKAAVDRGVDDLIVIGDSRLAIQQSMGVIACKKDSLQVELARHKDLTSKLNSVRYLHVVRYYNASADSLATEALECKAGRVVLSADRKIELKTLNRISEVLYAGTNPADKARTIIKQKSR
jgi:ribonuclease HI